MANSGLPPLIPTIYRALEVISRELVGFIPAVTMDASAARAAVNQDVTIPIAPPGTAEDITAAVAPPATGSQTFTNLTMKITKSRAVPFLWNGEEVRGVEFGPSFDNLRRDQIVQAMRTLVNEVETDLAGLYAGASRATGTAGTAPFASTIGDSAQVRKILADNGAPMADLQLVIDTTAGANLRTLPQLTKANEAGDDAPLRRGVLLDINGFAIRESAQVKLHTIGTGAGYLVNDATPPGVGETAITVDTGTGTIVAGDVMTGAGNATKYVVGTALAANVVTLNQPGLRHQTVDNDALTVGAAYRANFAFHRGALVLLARAPALP